MSASFPIALMMGLMLGVSAHRAGLCTVKAVAEVITSRRGWVLWSFLKAALWATGTILFGLPALSPHALPGWAAIVAGIFSALVVMRALGRPLPAIRCESDICRASL